MAAPQAPPRKAPTPGKSSTPGGWSKEWNGLPVWAWVGIGAVSVAGLYVFVRGYRKAAAAKTSTTSSGATTGNTALPDIPPLPPLPDLPAAPSPAPLTSLPPEPPLPPLPTPAGTAGHVYTAQDVTDVFARFGFVTPTQIQKATVTPTSETADQRVARILRDLNSGTRSLAQVTDSISKLPGSAALPKAA